MSPLTDAFDISVQVREQVIRRIVQAQHRFEIMRHHYVRGYQGRRVELLLNSPRLDLVTDPQPDQRARVRMISRVHYNSRDYGDVGDTGTSAVADVTIRAVLRLSTGDPGRLTNRAALLIDWSETGRNDIVVHGASSTISNEVKDALLDFVRDYGGGQVEIPPIGSPDQQIDSLAFRFLAGPNQTNLLAVGMNVAGPVRGDKAGLQLPFVQQDWALAFSEDFLLGELRQSLRDQFGNRLPPPHGPSPVEVSNREVCTLPGPFGICIDHSRQRVFIDSLDVDLRPGVIRFRGRLRVTTSAFYIPDINADFSVSVTLSIGADQSLRVTVGTPVVDVHGFFADVANFLSGGGVEAVIANGLRNSLQSGFQQGQISEFFSAGWLQRFSSLHGTTNLQINLQATAVEIRSDALIIHGGSSVPDRSARPRAPFDIIRPAHSRTRRILHAGRSWAPGRRIVSYHWEFGDGQTENRAGHAARFVTAHNYAPGVYQACLTLTDDTGQISRRCQTLETARLSLRHTEMQHRGRWLGAWRACQTADPIPVEFTVVDQGAPVPDVHVRVEGRRPYELEGYTNAQGKVSFQLDITGGHSRIDTRGRGFMIVRASKQGYLNAPFQRLVFIDCEALFEVVDFGRNGLRDLLEMYGRVVDRLGPGFPLGPGGEPPEPGPPGPDGPPWSLPPRGGRPTTFDTELAEISLALDVLTKLLLLAEKQADALPLEPLLGIDAAQPEAGTVLLKRFEEGFAAVKKSIRALEEARGPHSGAG